MFSQIQENRKEDAHQSRLLKNAPPWIIFPDSEEPGRVFYFSPADRKAMWEPEPEEEKVRFDGKKHGAFVTPANLASSIARRSRVTKIKLAETYLEKGQWERAAGAFDKAIEFGAGLEPEAMKDNAKVRYKMWDLYGGDDPHLEVAMAAMNRSFGLAENYKDPVALLASARLYVAAGSPAGALQVLKHVIEDYADCDMIEDAILNAAWVLKECGSLQGAINYTEYLQDVPPTSLPRWVLPLLLSFIFASEGNLIDAMSYLESGQGLHSQDDLRVRKMNATEWFQDQQVSPSS